MYRKVAQAFGAFFTIASVICLLVALCTTYWVIVQVNRTKIDKAPIDQLAYFTRNRGLFRECWTDSNAASVIQTNSFRVGSSCLQVDYLISRQDVAYSSDYVSRAALMVAMIVVFCTSLVFAITGFGVFCYSLTQTKRKVKWALIAKWSGILLFISGFFNALGMAFFHGVEYMETQNIIDFIGQAPYPEFFSQSQSKILQSNTSRVYGWSYALGWLALALELLAALLLFFAGVFCYEYSNEELANSSTSSGHGLRNRAYEYFEEKLPYPPPAVVGSPAVYVPEDYYLERRQPFYDPYSRGTLRSDFNPQYSYNEGWRWHS